MLRIKPLFVLFVVLFISAPAFAQGLAIGSWNIKRLGHGQKDFQAVAQVAGVFDLLAIQEVMKPDAVKQLVKQLEGVTGEDWDYINSHLIGRGRYKESYAFVFRTRKVTLDDGMGRAAVFLDSKDIFAREPFSAVFMDKTTGDRFVFANVHILWGKGISDRLPEIQFLDDYWGWLQETYEGLPLVLAGDFNLQPDHHGFDQLERMKAFPLITKGATTLSKYDGRYASLYDNLWISEATARTLQVKSSGIFEFPSYLGISHQHARDVVSDHAPVFMLTHVAELTPIQ